MLAAKRQPINNINYGTDAIALYAHGETRFFATTSGCELWSWAKALLRDRAPGAEIRTRADSQSHLEAELKEIMDTYTSNIVYTGNLEVRSISMFNPATGFLSISDRDQRFTQTDAVLVGFDGYMHLTQNQLWR